MNLYEALQYRPKKDILSLDEMINAVLGEISYKTKFHAAILVSTNIRRVLMQSSVEDAAKNTANGKIFIPGIYRITRGLISFDNASAIHIRSTNIQTFRGHSLDMLMVDNSLSDDVKTDVRDVLWPCLHSRGGRMQYFET